MPDQSRVATVAGAECGIGTPAEFLAHNGHQVTGAVTVGRTLPVVGGPQC